MHAEAEINFDCSGCGQHLCADAAAAGQATTCPACHATVTVPQEDVLGRIAAITNLAGGWSEPEYESPRAAEAQESEGAALREQLIDAMRVRSRMERELAAARVENEALQAQLRRAWEERDQQTASAERAKSERHELDKERADLLSERDELRQRISSQQEDLGAREQAVHHLQEKLKAAEAERVTLSQELIPLRKEAEQLRSRASLVEPLEKEVASLRKDIASSRDANEFHTIRLRAEMAEKTQKEQLCELENLRAEKDRLEKSAEELRKELAESNERCAAEARKLEELADGKVQRDNAVLRAVLGRQKAELENCYRDLKRYRRAQLGVRLAYALFALGLLGVAAFALQMLPGVADFLKNL